MVKHLLDSSPLKHIHHRIIRIAKNKLRQPRLTIGKITYLRFNYPTHSGLHNQPIENERECSFCNDYKSEESVITRQNRLVDGVEVRILD